MPMNETQKRMFRRDMRQKAVIAAKAVVQERVAKAAVKAMVKVAQTTPEHESTKKSQPHTYRAQHTESSTPDSKF
jgi:hypothetical protein